MGKKSGHPSLAFDLRGPRRVPKVTDAKYLEALTALQHLQNLSHPSASCNMSVTRFRDGNDSEQQAVVSGMFQESV